MATELDGLAKEISVCIKCLLAQTRTKAVPGDGPARAAIMFVGEGPGFHEDQQGKPFVGAAGQFLNELLQSVGLKREDVYITNVVKCRPPGNRTPEPDEMEICGQFLFRQLEAIHPKAICVLGGTAVRALLGRKDGVTRLRGNWFRWRDIPVMVTYHPSYLLRPYNQDAKREAWEDLKKVFHFVYD